MCTAGTILVSFYWVVLICHGEMGSLFRAHCRWPCVRSGSWSVTELSRASIVCLFVLCVLCFVNNYAHISLVSRNELWTLNFELWTFDTPLIMYSGHAKCRWGSWAWKGESGAYGEEVWGTVMAYVSANEWIKREYSALPTILLPYFDVLVQWVESTPSCLFYV